MKTASMFIKPISQLSDNIILRRSAELDEIKEKVGKILQYVKQHKDYALRELTLKFDGVEIKDIEVSGTEIRHALKSVDKKLISHLRKAASNIRAFHEAQRQNSWIKEVAPGLKLGQRITPLDSIGVYVPGGRASYPSTALMTVIPAKVAGVEEVMMCTPPQERGKVDSVILTAAHIAGVDRVFRVGGAQAIAAMAYGTETIPKVDKIVGPGNIYVTIAKMMCDIAIDFPAGPSEVLIIADSSARADFIASDMIAQAEHDPNAICILLTPSEELAKHVKKEIDAQLEEQPRKEIIKSSLDNAFILTGTMDECIEFSNRFAPEHLEIMTEKDILDRIKHAGSIFVGNYAPVSAGDYASGTNHVLPTSGYAKVFSGLGIDHFVKKSSVQIIDRKGLEGISKTIITLAEAEGLHAHANAVRMRKLSC